MGEVLGRGKGKGARKDSSLVAEKGVLFNESVRI